MRHNILKLALTGDANFVFLTETWLMGEKKNSEFFLSFCYEIISRNDREVREHGGVVIASRSNGNLEALDITIETFSFCCCCAVICEKIYYSSLMSTYLQRPRGTRLKYQPLRIVLANTTIFFLLFLILEV